jgi:hypothetical protein
LTTENARLREDRTKYKEELTSLQAKVNPKSAKGKPDAAASDDAVSVWWWVIGGALAAVAVVAGVWWVGGRGSETITPVEEETKSEVSNRAGVQP